MPHRQQKALVWVGSSRRDLRGWPEAVRLRAGYELGRIQEGLEATDWKPMTAAGEGVREIRLRVLGEHRILYAASFQEAVYVLHVFRKKSQKTAWPDMMTTRLRYREVLRRSGTRGTRPQWS